MIGIPPVAGVRKFSSSLGVVDNFVGLRDDDVVVLDEGGRGDDRVRRDTRSIRALSSTPFAKPKTN